MLTIVCPYCGAEYLPAEIFYPDEFMGKPSRIEKDEKGKIQIAPNSDMNLKESYVCDYCGHKLYVTAKVEFKAEIHTLPNSHITKFKKSNLFLDEKDGSDTF